MSAVPDETSFEALIQFLYQAPIGLIQTDRAGEIRMINPMAAMLLMPLSPGGNLDNLFDVLAEQAPQLRALCAGADRPGESLCDMVRLNQPADPARGIEARTLSLQVVQLNDATLMSTLTDITLAVMIEQQRLDSHLRDAARTDQLTGLPNRQVARDRIAQAIGRLRSDPAREFAVLTVNSDRFNQINLLHGRSVGDAVLRSIAQRLAPAAPEGNSPVGEASVFRLGRDEFVMLVEGPGCASQAGAWAQQVLARLAPVHVIGDAQIHLDTSVGVRLGERDVDADSLMQDTAIAVREAKRAGGARWLPFDPQQRERETLRGNIEHDLRRGLAAGELFVVYQPIVDLQAGGCAGLEALVRWRHPQRGIVPPIEFIGIAEETGLIDALGAFVLDEACRDFVAWQASLGEDAPHHMSVNVSRAQLAAPGLQAMVGDTLQRHGMAPASLQLEVTESLAAQDALVQSQLKALQALGVSLALDDFGTGYSSLACLHQLPVDVVKIDRSFVSRVESSPHHLVLVEATVRVARSLGMKTVAEGIETEGQARALASAQCDKGQGYLFARPLEHAQVERWLRRSGAERRAQARPIEPAAAIA